MAIDRLRSPYANQVPVGRSDVGPAAYASSWVSYLQPYTFIGDGTAGTTNGVTYRCHMWEYVAGQSYSITFNRAGVVDLLICAGGGSGGSAYHAGDATNNGWAGGGGGAGGLILQYNYGVSATSYNVTVGKGGEIPCTSCQGNNGANSTFGSLTAIGGGGGATGWTATSGNAGGSGGGCAVGVNATYNVGVGTVGQGNNGGSRSYTSAGAGGGGGYSQVGGQGTPVNSSDPTRVGGKGGDGISIRFDGTTRGFSAGGGGGMYSSGSAGVGGIGGGGNGTLNDGNGGNASGFGCGGGGAGTSTSSRYYSGGYGSNGLVIVRYAIG